MLRKAQLYFCITAILCTFSLSWYKEFKVPAFLGNIIKEDPVEKTEVEL